MKAKRWAAFPLLLALFAALPATLLAQETEPGSFVTLFGESELELDPQRSIFSSEAQIFTAMYEGLFSYDPSTLEARPALAESFTRSKDGLEYSFTLRRKALWSDGTPILASDFRDSWLRMLRLNADYAAFFDLIAGAKEIRLGSAKDGSSFGVKAEAPDRLIVTLTRPAEYFTRLLCHHSFAPIHPSMLKAMDWKTAFPFPVSGPYVPKSYSGGKLMLEKNPNYWDRASVSIPALEMVFTDDDAEASRMFNNGQAHWLAGPGDYDTILLEQAVQVNPIFSTHYWYFDCSQAPFSDSRVRRALALLLPWQEIRDPERYMVPTQTLVLSLPGYASATGIEKSAPAEAKRLLSLAGFPEGAGLPKIQIHYADGASGRRIAQIMEKAWKDALSLEVSLAPIPPSKYYESLAEKRASGSVGIAHSTWIGDFADPEAFLQMWKSDSSLNDARLKDPAFDALMEKSYAKEAKERFRLLAEAETLLLEGAAVLPIYHSFAASVIDIDYIEGWFQNALDIHPYKYLRFGTPSIGPNVASLGAGTERL